jgi:hypothetical protein
MSASTGFIHYSRWWLRFGRWIVLALFLGCFAVAYVHVGRLLIEQTNHTDEDILSSDQKHNIKLALEMRADLKPDFNKGFTKPIKDWFPRRTDGVVNPLWPWIAAWLAEDGHTISGEREVTEQDRAIFNRGRWFHVGMTLGFVVLLGVACARLYSLPAAMNVVLLVGFGALLPRAAYFQPEPVYFVFVLLTWVACIFALKCNTLWSYGAIGVCSGIAYMAKGSVHPLLVVFIAVSTLRWAWGWLMAHWPGHSTSLWVRRNHFFGLFILLMAHLLTIGPRLAYSAEHYGRALHSYPEYWMWFDDFKDCYAWMDAHNTKEELLAMTDDTRPSYANYAATHTREQMLDRLISGTKVKLGELFWPGYTKESRVQKPWKGVLELRGVYLGVLLLVLLLLVGFVLIAGRKAEHAGERLHPEAASIVLFVLGTFTAYSLAYGWYTPIGRGDRFMLSLYAPMVLSLVWAGESLLKRARRRKSSLWIFITYESAHWLLFLALSWRLIEILQFPHFRN